ncbi:MAG: murein transglycosylase A [Candidatus Binatia bacterium]
MGEFPRTVTAREVRDSLLLFLQGLDSVRDPSAFADWVKSRFDFYSSSAARDKVLFTGYYRPVVQASLTENQRFRFPIYGKPKDLIEAELVTLFPERHVGEVVGRVEKDQWLPYFSRAEIDRDGRLKGRGDEIAWLDDPVEVFFLHVQGSGVLRLDNGHAVSVGFAASNGRPYRSIGKILVDQGELPMEEVTMQRLKRYLNDYPEKRDALLNQNERYIFFRIHKEGALGSLDVPLTPGRSIATDARLFPQGALAFIDTQEPVFDRKGNHKGWKPLRRFVLNQDRGAAIRGAARVDFYFGTGVRAGWSAGIMNRPGNLFFLIKK